MDDSESMVDNESKVLAFEALSLVANALKMIEIKNLGLYRFGAETETVLNFGDELTDTTGGNLIEKCTFEQQSTNMVEMLQYTLRSFLSSESGGETSHKLLIIVSDGRGIFSQGRKVVSEAVKKARQA